MTRAGKGAAQARRGRLTDLTLSLRQDGPQTAAQLGQKLGVTPRTIWRDVDALRASGIDIQGTRGQGYALGAPITLPPLGLTLAELEALHFALAILGEATDPALATASASLADKIDAQLPERSPGHSAGFAVHPFADAAAGHAHIPLLRDAIRGHKRLRITTQNMPGPTTRIIQPSAVNYLGRVWMCEAWCEETKAPVTLPAHNILRAIDTGACFTSAQTP